MSITSEPCDEKKKREDITFMTDPDRADRDGCFPRGSNGHWMHQTVQVTPWSFIKKKDGNLCFVQDY
jgi:hypothetical protein